LTTNFTELVVLQSNIITEQRLTTRTRRKERATTGRTFSVMDKMLVQARHHPDFEEIEDTEYSLYYQMTLENDGDDQQRHGIWTNGYLTETTCYYDFVNAFTNMTLVE
jgi:hypothetical protein